MEDDNTKYRVELYIYDLSQGLASVMSQMLVGRQLDGIWHTSVVVYGKEFFFGSTGIQSCTPVSVTMATFALSTILYTNCFFVLYFYKYNSPQRPRATYNRIHSIHSFLFTTSSRIFHCEEKFVKCSHCFGTHQLCGKCARRGRRENETFPSKFSYQPLIRRSKFHAYTVYIAGKLKNTDTQIS